MIIIGMTGPIGHGKTTLAKALEEQASGSAHLEFHSIIAEVSNHWHARLKEPFDPYDINDLNHWIRQLPTAIAEVLRLKIEYEKLKIYQTDLEQYPEKYQKLILHGENLRRNFTLAHQSINEDNKETYRPILQWIGGYLVDKIDPKIWSQEILRRIKLIDSDKTELCIVGGLRYPEDAIAIRSVGGIIIKVFRPSMPEHDKLDPTERERDQIQPDITVYGNGTGAELAALAPQIWADIVAGVKESAYTTVQSKDRT